MNYYIIGIGAAIIIIIVLLYRIYCYLFPEKSTVSSKNYLLDASIKSIPLDGLKNPTSRNYSIELWLYINKLPKTETNIFSYSPSNSVSLNIDSKNTLTFQNTDTKEKSLKISNIPLHRWVYIVINVKYTLVEMYLDGKMVDSMKIPSRHIQSLSYDDSIVFGNIDAYIAGMNRNTKLLDLETIQTQYYKGKMDLRG